MFECRDGHRCRKVVFLLIVCNDRKKCLFVERVDLVDDEENGRFRFTQVLEDVFFTCTHLFIRIDDEKNEVYFFERIFRRVDHILAQFVTRFVDTRRIKEENLCIVERQHAENAIACRLRFVRHDKYFLSDQAVDKRRLTDVWAADNGNKARFISCFQSFVRSSSYIYKVKLCGNKSDNKTSFSSVRLPRITLSM